MSDKEVKVYSTPTCSYCKMAKKFLEDHGIQYQDLNVAEDRVARDEMVPNSELARGIARLNKIGEIEVNCACETGMPGLLAAGDVTDAPEKQIVVAAGERAKAALQAHRYLQRL